MLHIPLPDHLTRKQQQQPEEQLDETTTTTTTTTKPSMYPNLNELKLSAASTMPRRLWNDTILLKSVSVKSTDSVVSIACRCGLSVAELRTYNPTLIFDYCDFTDIVWIPDDGTTTLDDSHILPRDAAILEFRSKTGCTFEEASFYLDDAHYNVDKALQQWTADEEFERKNPR